MKTIFGPVKSRRLGISLGINLLPETLKICNFDCIYCECGLNNEHSGNKSFKTRTQIYIELDAKLAEMESSGETIDTITFAGNGEPTLHPEFAEIIDDTIALRNKWFKNTKISVFSNATMLHKSDVFLALKKVDKPILKLDAGIYKTIESINQPVGEFNLDKLIDNLQQFEGKLTIQTMFTRGMVNGKMIDNTKLTDLVAWQNAVESINPQEIMIYTIDRDTPYNGLAKVSNEELENIAKKVWRENRKVSVHS